MGRKRLNFALFFHKRPNQWSFAFSNRPAKKQENERIKLLERTNGVWHIGMGSGRNRKAGSPH